MCEWLDNFHSFRADHWIRFGGGQAKLIYALLGKCWLVENVVSLINELFVCRSADILAISFF